MIPSPRRAVSQPIAASTWADLDDDEGWQDMPVVRSEENPFGLDKEDEQLYHYQASSSSHAAGPSASNAVGEHLEVGQDTLLAESWRQKAEQDESDYTRLRLDEDEESEEVHMRTRYLFNEDKAMTPLSQMQATKELLTEGQRIAYVGLCQLIALRMVRDCGRGWEGVKVKATLGKGKGKQEIPVVESAGVWMLKIMARLYQHMELEQAEQRMIESLGEHGVDPADLVPALMTTHTVKNPEYDPAAKKRAEMEAALGVVREEDEDEDEEAPPPYGASLDEGSSVLPRTAPFSPGSDRHAGPSVQRRQASPPPVPATASLHTRSSNPFGSDDESESPTPPSSSRPPVTRPTVQRVPSYEEEDGDLGAALSPSPDLNNSSSRPSANTTASDVAVAGEPPRELGDPEPDKRAEDGVESGAVEGIDVANGMSVNGMPEAPQQEEKLPSLPGVSTQLSTTDEMVTLDIRWTVEELCDLFLVLIADSVYDARSRAFLERVALALGFNWLDVVRFENRVTDALEIQEAVEKTNQDGIIEGRVKTNKRRRYAMMGAAAAGGALVIGLSAGLLAPVIGAGLGAAFATVGITGTTGFLAGAGGAAVITTTGVLTGANIAGKGMARRTREVRTFEFRPLHNNKRVSCYITMGGFMASKVDDVRLPFSTVDPIIGDVYSVLWEPEMMHEMGGALRIFGTEILTQVGQNVLQATIMTGLMSALTWPMVLTKLGYLIDNPWSNALDRSYAAGLILADVIINRQAGIRPISLIGYSLGARAIFYALAELAKHKAFGLVQDVFIFGSTVAASRQTWLDVKSVVAGRLVNGFARNDWMLGYLFRMTSGGLQTVAGLRPVEGIAGLENVDVTDIITGHMSYRSCMPQLLARVGFPVTAEWFDEPEDPDIDMSVQERTVINAEEELAKKKRSKVLGIFPVRGEGARSAWGTSTPNANGPAVDAAGGVVAPRRGSIEEYDEDADEPPREEADIGDIASPSYGESQSVQQHEAAAEAEAEAVKAIPKTAGFDFGAIGRELGKEIDPDKVKPEPRPSPVASLPPDVLERTGSAPPISIEVPPGDDLHLRSRMARSASYAHVARTPEEEDDDAGDITRSTSEMTVTDVPSWDRPATKPSPPLAVHSASDNSLQLPAMGGWNAWSAPITETIPSFTTPSLRAAPPARPHPAEWMENPFASSNGPVGNGLPGAISGTSAWGQAKAKSQEEDAIDNPW